MWSFIDNIPQASLDFWFRWLTFLAIGLPILGAAMGGVCGWGAFIVSNRIGNLQKQIINRQNVEIETLKPWQLSADQQKSCWRNFVCFRLAKLRLLIVSWIVTGGILPSSLRGYLSQRGGQLAA
jgi:hypothetical protein